MRGLTQRISMCILKNNFAHWLIVKGKAVMENERNMTFEVGRPGLIRFVIFSPGK